MNDTLTIPAARREFDLDVQAERRLWNLITKQRLRRRSRHEKPYRYPRAALVRLIELDQRNRRPRFRDIAQPSCWRCGAIVPYIADRCLACGEPT